MINELKVKLGRLLLVVVDYCGVHAFAADSVPCMSRFLLKRQIPNCITTQPHARLLCPLPHTSDLSENEQQPTHIPHTATSPPVTAVPVFLVFLVRDLRRPGAVHVCMCSLVLPCKRM